MLILQVSQFMRILVFAVKFAPRSIFQVLKSPKVEDLYA
jgi:hypothetical protein